MSNTDTAARRTAPGEWPSRIGWALVALADKLYSVAHWVSRGDTPMPDVLTMGHIRQVADAVGLEASELIAIAEKRGTVSSLR